MISIIVPTLNEEKVLSPMLKALRQLSVVNYEIIVSDGGSTDGTLAIAEKLADIVIKHGGKARQTIGIGRNAGAEAASGEYLLFLDADVFIPHINESMLKAQKAFIDNPELVGLTVFLKVLPDHVTLSDQLFFGISNRLYQLFVNVFHMGMASGEFMMVKTSSFKQIGGFSPQLVMGEDQDLFSRLAKIGRTRIETGLFVYHTARRAHETGWVPLLLLWWGNLIHNKVFKRSLSKEWKVIR